MSPIAAILTVALAGAAAPAAPSLSVPPIVVEVALLTDVSPMVVSAAIEETQALFRSAGVKFIWRRDSSFQKAVIQSLSIVTPYFDATCLGCATATMSRGTFQLLNQ